MARIAYGKNLKKICKNNINAIIDHGDNQRNMVINTCYDKLIKINHEINLNEHNIPECLREIGKDNKEKTLEILEKFIQTPFYINYKDKVPNDNDIDIIKKLCILKLLFHKSERKNYVIISKKIKYFKNKEKEFEKKDKKVRMFALIDTFKYC